MNFFTDFSIAAPYKYYHSSIAKYQYSTIFNNRGSSWTNDCGACEMVITAIDDMLAPHTTLNYWNSMTLISYIDHFIEGAIMEQTAFISFVNSLQIIIVY